MKLRECMSTRNFFSGVCFRTNSTHSVIDLYAIDWIRSGYLVVYHCWRVTSNNGNTGQLLQIEVNNIRVTKPDGNKPECEYGLLVTNGECKQFSSDFPIHTSFFKVLIEFDEFIEFI